ncbi:MULTISPECIES: DUF2334 domain-containing protein [unclassified Prochlorococcus]|uniref:DUF2334 domain-containing protein n=1 Tax=unclassified Prochlorococcus TaxID=2627481 RepID=UPI000533902F|nr:MULTISPECIES: DUF2334 domain-containing protein [unclassified Prochlorococcus]KGG15580.1 hypothetical protein EV06_1454 [Prochlorococcus sp. MIT 0602]KGG17860.1 hypothetical protein EV07_1302 [Prochlorococcus sp. MIT 0603]
MTKYILRLDDACHTFKESHWQEIERILDENSIKPIVGVIPFNEDKDNFYNPLINDFWEIIRRWQSKGWIIALHGYNHVCHDVNAENTQFLPLNNKSEFVGLCLREQKEKIIRSLNIFENNDIKPVLFMAPCHSFDKVTLSALDSVSQIKVITDGFSYRPYYRFGFKWIPQQLWRFRSLPFGTWTVCLHPNTMSRSDIYDFSLKISKYRKMIINPHQIIENQMFNRYGLTDLCFDISYRYFLKLKKIISYIHNNYL